MTTWRCGWPKGCWQQVSLIEGREDGTCFYHHKVLRAKVDPHVPVAAQRWADPAGVVSDERLALGDALLRLGATPERVRDLLTTRKEPHVPWGRRSQGVKQGRLMGLGEAG